MRWGGAKGEDAKGGEPPLQALRRITNIKCQKKKKRRK
jgi:hypothetical protein